MIYDFLFVSLISVVIDANKTDLNCSKLGRKRLNRLRPVYFIKENCLNVAHVILLMLDEFIANFYWFHALFIAICFGSSLSQYLRSSYLRLKAYFYRSGFCKCISIFLSDL